MLVVRESSPGGRYTRSRHSPQDQVGTREIASRQVGAGQPSLSELDVTQVGFAKAHRREDGLRRGVVTAEDRTRGSAAPSGVATISPRIVMPMLL